VFTVFLIVAGIAIAIQSLLLFLTFFGPEIPYRVTDSPGPPVDCERFSQVLATLTDCQFHADNQIEVLTNGDNFYEAELGAISSAQRTINLEAFIFYKGEIGDRFVEALAERARAGIKVKLIVDYLGSFKTKRTYFRKVIDAGGRLEWYHSPRLDLLPQINNRTHRELLVIDGVTGFIGGAGIADQWYKGAGGAARWRDTMFRVRGPAVTSLQSVFAENWLRVAGEILTSEEYFVYKPGQGESLGAVINSTPAAGSTRARILYQLLIASARQCIYISTPYFLPDRSARKAVVQAIQERNVKVKIITPGQHSDHLLTRSSSQRLYGSLLKAGAVIGEYQPAMIHAKIMIVDDLWSVVGSTNFDHRSFEINDEVNLTIADPAIAKRLTEDFNRDLEQSKVVTYEEWRKRAPFRISEWLGALIEKQE
jgi:cardiolipin synthase